MPVTCFLCAAIHHETRLIEVPSPSIRPPFLKKPSISPQYSPKWPIHPVPITRTSLDQIPTFFATVSVGTPNDPLELKLKAISSARFQAIKLGFPDFLSFASSHSKKEINDNDFKILCGAGKEVKKLCEKSSLES
jgi:hypothetical protein